MTSTIGEILPVAARRFGTRTALLVGDRVVLVRRPRGAVEPRRERPRRAPASQPGDRVALYGPNCWEWLVAYYGIAKTGAVVIPVNVMLTPDEVRYVVEDSGARAVVASADKGEPLLDLHGTGTSRRSCCGATSPAGATAFADWLARGSAEFTPVHRDAGDLAAICYTSGTTGPPEGRDAAAPRGDRRRRGHGGDGGARARRSRHQLAAAAARLRLVRLQRGA